MQKNASHAAGLHRASLTKLHDLDAALELMYYGWRGMTLAADQYLATLGLLCWSRSRPSLRSGPRTTGLPSAAASARRALLRPLAASARALVASTLASCAAVLASLLSELYRQLAGQPAR